jgi:hypothetical protein
MRGLDPRIHHSPKDKKVDCRVKPGNDVVRMSGSAR